MPGGMELDRLTRRAEKQRQCQNSTMEGEGREGDARKGFL